MKDVNFPKPKEWYDPGSSPIKQTFDYHGCTPMKPIVITFKVVIVGCIS